MDFSAFELDPLMPWLRLSGLTFMNTLLDLGGGGGAI